MTWVPRGGRPARGGCVEVDEQFRAAHGPTSRTKRPTGTASAMGKKSSKRRAGHIRYSVQGGVTNASQETPKRTDQNIPVPAGQGVARHFLHRAVDRIAAGRS